MIGVIYISVLLLAAAPKFQKQEVQLPAVEVTLCQLAERPTEFSGKLVTFQAQFESDGIERSALQDSSCPGKGSVLPSIPDGIPGADAFNDAMYIGHPGTLDKTITATFTGVYKYSAKPEMCMFLHKDVCRRVVTVTNIKNLVLVMKQKGK